MDNKMVVAVKGIVLYEHKILVIQRSDDDEVGPGTWEFAGGKVEFGENLEASLIREIQEEAGLSVKVDSLLYASTFLTSPNRQVVLLTYKCLADSSAVRLSPEHSAYAWVTKEEIKGLLHPPIIEDMEKNKVFALL
ncbi:MAG: NUDIX domain-containing protein [Clostridia bacterium]|nr:NUDIX domain-containing protein [Clostridia bacterium]